MPFNLCFPCSPSSAAKNVSENDLPQGPTNKEPSDPNITPPTGAEYAGQAAREFFHVLEAVAEAVPIPAFGTAVKVATNIIKACDDSQATLEGAEDLKVRVKILVTVFANALKGKKRQEIPDKLIQDIDVLLRVSLRDMECIEKTLDKITSQHCFLLIFFRSLNDNKVRECIAKVNNLLESFNLARTIDLSMILAQLEQQIMIYTHQQESPKTLQFTMDDVKAILNEHLPVGDMLSPRSRAPIPINSAIFYGRDSLIAELVSVITGPLRKHICLFGPGGMGKTSTSVAVMGHPDVKAKYESHFRVWVPCVKATSASLFLETLRSSLAILKETGDARGAILAALQASPPIVILLDNFETPWDADGARPVVEQVLRDIHSIEHVTLFITTRSSPPPCDDLPWYPKDLHGVDENAAQEIYTAHHPESCYDPDLSHLLKLLGYMPLAITLMAKVAKMIHLFAAQLVDEYKTSGTSILGQGLDAQSSMDVSIGLSVYSLPMKAHPEAFKLLCTFSMLPAGTSFHMLSKWWARGLTNLVGALNVLKGASLVEEGGSTYFVLPVIQRYILDPSRFDPEIHTSMIESACAFLKQHEAELGDPLYKEYTAALSQEEDNLEAVLLQVTTPDPHVIQDGLFLLARYQQLNRPRLDIIEHALKLVQALDDNLLHGDILHCYGHISMGLDPIPIHKSLQYLKEALNLFLSVPDRKKAAYVYLSINDALIFHPDAKANSRIQTIKEAQINFQSLNDLTGLGCCYLAFGVLGWQYATTEETFDAALNVLKMAESIFAEAENWSWHATSTIRLASFFYWACEYYDLAEAYSWAASSLEESKSIGSSLGCVESLHTLGQIASAQGDYERALEHFLQCLEVNKCLGLPPDGEALEGMGVAWTKLGRFMDAEMAYKEALHQYSSEETTRNSWSDIHRIQFFLKYLEDPKLSPSADEREALSGWYSKFHIDRILASL
ncbi:hypothetical protein C0995_002881 [Termitomyces sp. Mi166|nr:hypothetical protein C0995_002881 [Termitomyces sp. Mi166\